MEPYYIKQKQEIRIYFLLKGGTICAFTKSIKPLHSKQLVPIKFFLSNILMPEI